MTIKQKEQEALDRDFIFTHKDFERVRAMVYQHAGIALNDNKESLVYSRLARRLRVLSFRKFDEYLHYVESNGEEFQSFINSLTTNLTAFFRENHHFDMLRDYLLQQKQNQRSFKLWSAAASTGEEPYSIIMTCAETFHSYKPPVQLLATDLDTKVLETGKQGVYGEDRIEKLSEDRKKRFFYRGKGSHTGKVKVIPALQSFIEFKQLNLLDKKWNNVPTDFDIIFCRNVMIYFDKPTQNQILARLAQHLRKGGLFFAGHSETFSQLPASLRSIGRTAYQKV